MTAARAKRAVAELASAKQVLVKSALAKPVIAKPALAKHALAKQALRASAMSACLIASIGLCATATAAPSVQSAPTSSVASRSTHPAPADAAAGVGNWIGKVVPPYPDGYKSNTGGCVGSGRSAEQICARSIGTIDDAEDRSLKFYAGELVGRIGNEARWKITDVVPYPKLQRGERVSMSTCMIDGVNDPGVIAIVDTAVEGADAREMFDAVRWAVKLDRRKGRFIPVKPTEVSCYNEGTEGE
ncbi:hypothetical protein [Lysobacter sp. CA199]|uniref:hypothetical protein n=1 Tax=Lysobacter sp. CA199 TaxID=3455608 RepID=UPI003F8D18C7